MSGGSRTAQKAHKNAFFRARGKIPRARLPFYGMYAIMNCMNGRGTCTAAVFDLDGTLIDSMQIWREVDEEFFARRGMPVPASYQEEIAHLGFTESARYTVRRYLPRESVPAVLEEWRAQVAEKYAAADAEKYFKPGALGYVRALHAAGVKLGVATASAPELFLPVLGAGGIAELFSAFATVDEAGAHKGCPDVFLLTAEKLGVPPSECVAFEDNLTALRAAKSAGMFAVGVFDEASRALEPQIRREADLYILNFSEMKGSRLFGGI